MKLSLGIRTTLCTASIFLSFQNATAKDAMTEFFEVEENKAAYSKAIKKGAVSQTRDRFMEGCEEEQARESGIKLDCSCVKSELDKMSDREVYYESVKAYQEYQELVEAIRRDGKEAAKAVRKQQKENRKTMADKLNATCKREADH